MSENIIKGKIFVVKDNIDTDQIIPARYLNLVPTIPDEYKKLGSYAMCGLPESYKKRYIQPGRLQTEYPIIVAGKNFGCGSSREHAPISLGAAGCKVIIANSFARIFFRNSIATGEVLPVELDSDSQIYHLVRTDDYGEINMDTLTFTVLSQGKETVFKLKHPGDVKDVIAAGGIFSYARKQGLIKNS